MEKEAPISMKTLKNSRKSKLLTILISVIITILVMVSGKYIYDNSKVEDVEPKAKMITLQQVIIAYAPETKSIIFLDRQTGKVEFSLSDSISLAIFALKSGEIVADYTSKVTK